MPLPNNIPPLHSTWEYEAAVRVLKALWAEAVSATYRGDNSKERNELEMRVDDWVYRNNLVPEGRGVIDFDADAVNQKQYVTSEISSKYIILADPTSPHPIYHKK